MVAAISAGRQVVLGNRCDTGCRAADRHAVVCCKTGCYCWEMHQACADGQKWAEEGAMTAYLPCFYTIS